MLTLSYLDSDEMLQKIDHMIDTLNSVNLRNAFKAGENLYLKSGSKATALVRSFKSINRIPATLWDPPMDLQHYLHGFGNTNVQSEKFFVAASLLQISMSEFENLPNPNEIAAKLVSNVSERLRKKGYIEFVTMDDLPYIEAQINPMLDNLTSENLFSALKSAEIQYLNGGASSQSRFGAQGYAFFGTTNKKLLINTVDFKNDMSWNVRLFWKYIKSQHRKNNAYKTLTPIQYLQLFLEGPGEKNATSEKLQLVAYLLKFSIRNNDDKVATAIINKVIDKLADRNIDPSLDNSALEMKSINTEQREPENSETGSEIVLLTLLFQQIELKRKNSSSPELKELNAKIEREYYKLYIDKNNKSSSQFDQSDGSEESVEFEDDNNNKTTNYFQRR